MLKKNSCNNTVFPLGGTIKAVYFLFYSNNTGSTTVGKKCISPAVTLLHMQVLTGKSKMQREIILQNGLTASFYRYPTNHQLLFAK